MEAPFWQDRRAIDDEGDGSTAKVRSLSAWYSPTAIPQFLLSLHRPIEDWLKGTVPVPFTIKGTGPFSIKGTVPV